MASRLSLERAVPERALERRRSYRYRYEPRDSLLELGVVENVYIRTGDSSLELEKLPVPVWPRDS
jgi:hypothetical protein